MEGYSQATGEIERALQACCTWQGCLEEKFQERQGESRIAGEDEQGSCEISWLVNLVQIKVKQNFSFSALYKS